MSVALPYRDLSNPMRKSWVIAVIVVLVLFPASAQALSTFTDAVSCLVALGGAGTAAAYRNHRNRT
ncbi:hypothetical protein [Streptomyces bambusae]|uniref:Holin n=1 Tax=Streptomyces bambusae TaxID=1550616 RepID=A0ABS6Z836_9ACTN|nr:hypothetical protein [Streptomyces bambusae]MBW5483736.1 hypothetical protein [Streptomyces bambusae]